MSEIIEETSVSGFANSCKANERLVFSLRDYALRVYHGRILTTRGSFAGV